MSHFVVLVTGSDVDGQLAPYIEDVTDAEECVTVEHSEEGFDYNPNAKWDWYAIGGRWKGFLPLKQGAMGKLAEQNVYVDSLNGVVAKLGQADIATKEAVDWRKLTYPPFAWLHEGEWVERGEMGWWGMVNDEKEEKAWNKQFKEFIKSLPDNTLLTTVDCHI
jgi:hypothetical protein